MVEQALHEAERALTVGGKLDRGLLAAFVQKHYNLPYPPDHYYMPIPDRSKISLLKIDTRPMVDEAVWLQEQEISGFLASLAEFAGEFDSLPDYWDIDRLMLGLGYGEAEGLTYYAVTRYRKPDVVVEFGSGLSTYYAVEGLKRNGRGQLICVEPYPADAFLPYSVANGIELIQEPIQTLDFNAILSRLSHKSIVFIDTTHVLKPGGDIDRLFLELLPALPSGTLVHLHDIFFPYPVIFEEHAAFKFSYVWNETLALAIFLRENPHWRVLHPGYWLGLHRTDKYREVFRKLQVTKQIGSAFWMQRSAAPVGQ